MTRLQLHLFTATVLTVAVSATLAQAPATGRSAQSVPSMQVMELPQWWTGQGELPGMPLDILVVFRAGKPGEPPAATINIPLQGAKDLALADVACNATEMRFSIPQAVRADFALKRSADGHSAEGDLKQGGGTFPVKMRRVTEEEARAFGPPRPQTPKPPFPYTRREVACENPKDKTKLAGTLTIPEGKGPHPVVLLITGSGPQDRDETIFGHKPFAVIADYLTRRGIAVLRVDDRGVGGSTSPTADPTTATFATDVEAGIAFLKQQPEIDAKRIALLGHSEGGVIAPMVAAKSADVAAIVLLSGSALPGSEILPAQLALLSRAAGVPEESIRRQVKAQQRIFAVLAAKTGAGQVDEAKLRDAVAELVREQLAAGGKAPDADQLEKATDFGMKQMQSAWMRFFIEYDPRAALRKVKCPVLALGGTLDLQVPPKENLPEIEKAVKEGGNKDVTTKELPGLNHLFQEAKTGTVQEYATIQQTMAPTALEEIGKWLQKKLRVANSE